MSACRASEATSRGSTQTVSTGAVGNSTLGFNYTAAEQLTQTNSAANGYDQPESPIALASGAVQSYNGADELTSSSDVTLLGTATATDPGSSSTLTLALPVTTTVNDQVIVSVVLEGSGSVTTPAGYAVATSTATGSSGSDARIVVLRHSVAAGDSTTLAVSATASSPKVATALVYRGVNPTSPIDAFTLRSAAATTRVSTTSITASSPGDHLVALLGANAATAPTWSLSSPPTMTVRASPSLAGIGTAADDGMQLVTGTVAGINATASASANLVGLEFRFTRVVPAL
ncbi:MAG: hypothetical protein ACRDJU_13885 [Actinomycetota bacterium]